MEFKILGPLEARSEAGAVTLTGSKRQIVLGALLLADGRPVPMDRLIDAVWGPLAPPTAGKQIRNAVSDLRGLLTGADLLLAPTGSHYVLDRRAGRLDAAEFTRRTAEARRLRDSAHSVEAVAEYRAALALWRGTALAGLDSPALQAQVVALNQQRLTSVEECLDLEMALGSHRELIGELTELVAENPLHEPLVARLILAQHRSGLAAGALHSYEQARRRLSADLGIDPGPELRRLHTRILAGEPAATRAPAAAGWAFVPANSLPAATGRFVGRRAELAHIEAAARGETGRSGPAVVWIDGMAGIGKTTLAVQAAHRLAADYPDGQLAVDLRAHAEPDRPADPREVLAALLRSVGAPREAIPASLEERAALWRARVSDRRVLLLLDDVDSAQEAAPLLPGGSGSLVLATSRRRLAPLDATHLMSLAELAPADGRDLFAGILADPRPHCEPEAVDEVLARCGLHPAAIRLAAVKLRHRPGWSIGHLARRLEDRCRLLAELRVGEADLCEGLNRSLRRLPPEGQHVFRLLRHLPGPRIAVREAAELAHSTHSRTEELLEALVEAHLLKPDTPGNYGIHEVVHAFAAQLETAGAGRVRPAAFERHGDPARRDR